MTKTIIGAVIFTFGTMSGCSIKHSNTEFRERFGKKTFQVSEPVESLAFILKQLSQKCLTRGYVLQGAGDRTTGTSKGVFVENASGDGITSIVVPFYEEARGLAGMKTGSRSSFLAIIDLTSIDDNTTEVKAAYRHKTVGKAIELWARKSSDACPEY